MKAVFFLGAALLCGCNSDDFDLNIGNPYYKNDYQLINATDQDVAFHIANNDWDGSERNAADDKYHYRTILPNHPAQSIRHQTNANERISVYAGTPDRRYSAKFALKVARDNRYHFLAWQGAGQFNVSLFTQQRQDVNSEYSLRLFAADRVKVRIGNKELTLNPGEVNGRYQLTNCAGSVTVNDIAVDVCDGTLGRSYLLVIDKQGRKGLYLEH